ncbi:MAG: PEP-CTERM sorting domain-containing protein [Betaproteobacteria bacterium]|nr:PEP-CTERM sorting domain-containing protein [Betaproteobacteria bacterium]
MKLKKIVAVLWGGLFAVAAHSGVVTISATKDATIGDGANQYGNTEYRWVGNKYGNYFSIFGFDLSSLTGYDITAVAFSAYHNFSDGDSNVGARIGTNNSWDPATVVTYSGLGGVLDRELASAQNLNQYQTWNLGAVSGNALTVALVNLGSGWNDYQAILSPNHQEAFLSVTYTERNNVPEPGSLALLGLGVLGMVSLRRPAKA